MRTHDNGNGIITGHPVEPLYGLTYLPKKFKIAFTVPGDNGVDLYINDIGCVVRTPWGLQPHALGAAITCPGSCHHMCSHMPWGLQSHASEAAILRGQPVATAL